MRAGDPWRRLAGCGSAARGSLLAAMLVTMTLASIALAVATTQWSFIIRREKERELIFRGVQIARAIDEWQGPGKGPPTTLEMLTKPPRPVLRKAYVDPMTAQYDDEGKLVEGTGEWELIPVGAPTGGAAATPATGLQSRRETRRASGGLGSRSPQIVPFLGVKTTSTELSIAEYREWAPETPLNEWEFRGIGVAQVGITTNTGGYELPRPPGFAGVRMPGGPPLRSLPGTGATGAPAQAPSPSTPRPPGMPGPPRPPRPPR